MRIPYRKPGKYGGQPSDDPLLTEEKFVELKKDLERLKKKQPGAAADVARLAELGDFSENAEYQLAKGRLRGINQRILVLEHQLNRAVIVKPNAGAERVGVGSTVTVRVDGKEKTYQILGSAETDPARGIISRTSPIGAALLGKRAGDRVAVKVGEREMEYVIVKVQ